MTFPAYWEGHQRNVRNHVRTYYDVFTYVYDTKNFTVRTLVTKIGGDMTYVTYIVNSLFEGDFYRINLRSF